MTPEFPASTNRNEAALADWARRRLRAAAGLAHDDQAEDRARCARQLRALAPDLGVKPALKGVGADFLEALARVFEDAAGRAAKPKPAKGGAS